MNVNIQPVTSQPVNLHQVLSEQSDSGSDGSAQQETSVGSGHSGIISLLHPLPANAAMAAGLRAQLLGDMTPCLNTAIRMANPVEFDRILNMPGIDVNMPSNGITPLMMTVRLNDVRAMKALLAHSGIQVNAGNMQGNTALHLAAQAGQIEQMDALLGMPGIDPNLLNIHGYTPLCIAAQHNRDEAVEVLLAYHMPVGTTPSNPADEYLKAYTQGMEWNAFKAVTAMLHTIPEFLEVRRLDGHTALTAAIKEGHHDVVQKLLNDYPGIDVNVAGEGLGTALNVASQYGNADMVLTLLRHPELDPGVPLDEQGTTVLHMAASRRNPNIVQALLSAWPGVDVNAEAEILGTPLHTAALCGDVDTLRVLAARVFDINQVTKDGWTALHFAAYAGKIETARFLLQHPDVEPGVLTQVGQYPSHTAMEAGHVEVALLLTQAELASFNRRSQGIEPPAQPPGGLSKE